MSSHLGDTDPETVIFKILHFNDVYNVDEQMREPLAGVARFSSALKSFRDDHTLTFFGGDALSPSTLSTQTSGKHMMEFLNDLKVDCAVYGNHDFDFGVQNLIDCAKESSFPWLLSNCVEVDSGLPLAEGKVWHIMEHLGVKIGVIGLIEPEWVDTLSMVDPEDVLVSDFCEVGASLSAQLREEEGCHFVFALTHMRWPNDLLLAKEVPGIDLVLGGHDHNAGAEIVDGRLVIKSGADFREFSRLELCIEGVGSSSPKLASCKLIELVTVDSRFSPDPDVALKVDSWTKEMNKQLAMKIGDVCVDLECRFDVLRRRECNLGNWIADVIMTAVETDVSIINAGTLRADCIFPAGPFTYRDLSLLLPFVTTIVVQHVTGRQIIAALENGVSQVPRLEGRFPVVSGISFAYDAALQPGHRIIHDSVRLTDNDSAPFNPENTYRLASQSYMAQGHDGYDVLAGCPYLIDDENGPSLSNCLINYFKFVEVVNTFKSSKFTRQRSRSHLISRAKRRNVIESHKGNRNEVSHWGIIREAVENSDNSIRVEPKVDGRIREF